MSNPEGMITVQEAAQRLGRSIEQVRRYLREGKLKGERIGQQWFIQESSLPERPLRYRIRKPRAGKLREPAAVLEERRVDKEEIKALVRRLNANREAIRRRLGGDLALDVVEMLRIDREEH